jgi:hypothetical protein
MPNLKTTAPGGGGAMRPNPQQQAYMSMMRRTANTQLSGMPRLLSFPWHARICEAFSKSSG